MSDRFNLRAARINRGWSQEDLAGETGVSVDTIQRLEAGKGARPANAKKIADVFGVQVTDLMPIELEAA